MFYIISLLKSLIFFTGSYSVNVFPSPLEKDEEEKLINQMLMGDTDARGKLIEHNLRLVAHIVKKYEGKEYDSDDLISIGTIGLVKGIDSYKPSKNTRITTYVARCIENEVLMYFRSNKKHLNNVSLNDSIGYDKDGNEINLIDVLKCESEDTLDKIDTQNKIDLLLKYLDTLSPREKDIIIKRYGLFNTKDMTQKEIAKKMNVSVDKVREVIKISQDPVSLETPIGEEDDSHLGDFIQDEDSPAPQDAASYTLLREQLEEVMKTLTPREAKVLKLRFGLEDGKARTLEEVGREFDVTRERIRQIEAKALRKLRQPSRSKRLLQVED